MTLSLSAQPSSAVGHRRLVDQWLADGASSTRTIYRRAIERWFDHCDAAQVDVLRPKPFDVQNFADTVLANEFAESTAKAHRAALSSFYACLRDSGLIARSPVPWARKDTIPPLTTPSGDASVAGAIPEDDDIIDAEVIDDDLGEQTANVGSVRFTPPGGGGEIVLVPHIPPDDASGARRAFLLGWTQSPNTLRTYARTLDEWFRFCGHAGIDPLEASRTVVDAYKTWLFDTGRKPATVGTRLSAIASFYGFCWEEELIRRNPTRGVRRPKLSSESTSTGLDRAELLAFLEEARRQHPMLYALACLLGLNGLRASEPCTANVDNLETVRGHHTLAVVRKGIDSKVRVPLAPMTMQAIEEWLPWRAAQLGQSGRGSGPILLRWTREGGSRTGDLRDKPMHAERPDRRDIHRWVRRIGRLSVPHKPKLHPHDLRHAFVTLALEAGVPLQEVQDSAGHATPATTQRYNRNRRRLDAHATYTLATYLTGGGGMR
jgi:site-specific recombinase XerD